MKVEYSSFSVLRSRRSGDSRSHNVCMYVSICVTKDGKSLAKWLKLRKSKTNDLKKLLGCRFNSMNSSVNYQWFHQ